MCRGRGRGRFLPSFFSLSNGALSPDNTLRSRSPLNLAPDTGAQPVRSPRPEPPPAPPANSSRPSPRLPSHVCSRKTLGSPLADVPSAPSPDPPANGRSAAQRT